MDIIMMVRTKCCDVARVIVSPGRDWSNVVKVDPFLMVAAFSEGIMKCTAAFVSSKNSVLFKSAEWLSV